MAIGFLMGPYRIISPPESQQTCSFTVIIRRAAADTINVHLTLSYEERRPVYSKTYSRITEWQPDIPPTLG